MVASITIERIQWEQKRVQKELKRLEQTIAEDFNELTAPPPPSNNKLETMISVAMVGYKLFQRFGKATRGFSRGRRKR